MNSENFPFVACDAPGVHGLMTGWIVLAVSAMLVSLVYGTILIVIRVVGAGGGDTLGFFHASLVQHVNFAVLVWFMSVSAMVWSRVLLPSFRKTNALALTLSITGSCMMAITPVLFPTEPILADYVPVLNHPWFYGGLVIFISGILLVALCVQVTTWPAGGNVVVLAARAGSLITLLAAATFAADYFLIQEEYLGTEQIKILFWGSGHVLQLNHMVTLSMLVAALPGLEKRQGLVYRYRWLLVSLTCLALLGPFLAASQKLGWTWGGRDAFTLLMEVSGTLLAIWVLEVLTVHWRAHKQLSKDAADEEGVWIILTFGACLLLLGGVAIGYFIVRNDSMVPAHYHGAIGAITLICMGFVFFMMKGLGIPLQSWKQVKLQGLLYAIGIQLMIAGLILADVPRKMPAADIVGGWAEVFGRSLTGLGGSLALVGGFWFVVLVFGGLIPGKQNANFVYRGADGQSGTD